MICKHCGNPIRDDFTACPYCGGPVAGPVAAPAGAPAGYPAGVPTGAPTGYPTSEFSLFAPGSYTGGPMSNPDISEGTIVTGHDRHSQSPRRSDHGKKKGKRGKKRKLSGSELALRICLIVVALLAVVAILLGIGYLYVQNLVEDNANIDDKSTQVEQDHLAINPYLPTQDIQNIVLFGLDERGETDALVDEAGKGKSFHSDAIIILTVDRRDPANPRVKLSSLARDTLVYVEGYSSKGSMTKLTHAFDYGYRKAKRADLDDNGVKDLTEADYKREGAKTAIKTINSNFNMNVSEYIYVNFVEFMDIIDYVGGVEIDVQQRELNELNKHVRAMEKECGRDLNQVKKAGKQTLSGGQALAYARIRKIDSDLKRANRQRDVLKAVFAKMKSTPLNKLPDTVAKLLNMCHTTLTANEVVELGTWALTNSPEIINYTLPDTKVNANWIWEGTHPNYGWVWIYDLDYATYLLHDFIFDTETAKEHPLPTMPNEPKVTVGGGTTTTTNGGGVILPPTSSSTGGFIDNPYVDPTGTPSTDLTGDPTGDPTGDGSGVIGPVDPTATGDATGGTQSTDVTGTDSTTTPVDNPVDGTTGTTAFIPPHLRD